MKKIIKDPGIYFFLGLLGLVIAIPSENIYINLIFIPIFFLMQLIGIILSIRKYFSEKKAAIQEGRNKTDAYNIKPDISLWMSLLAAFGSFFALVASIVLLVFLQLENLDIFKYFIIVTCGIHVVIIVISFIALYKILANKKKI